MTGVEDKGAVEAWIPSVDHKLHPHEPERTGSKRVSPTNADPDAEPMVASVGLSAAEPLVHSGF
jgi:hypothetical protein